MKLLRAVSIAAVLLPAFCAFAQSDDDVLKCRRQTDSLMRLTCYDAIAVSALANDMTSSPGAESKALPDVTFVSADLTAQPKDIEKHVYNASVNLTPTFVNASKKTVVAIGHHMTIIDAFGDKIVDGDTKIDIKIPPGKTVKSGSSYFWEDNPYIQGEIYDKLIGPVSTSSAKATLTVTKVVFSDGTVESF